VGDGYDARVATWESWSANIANDPRGEWTADLAARLPHGAQVLELGCGNGTRETRELARRFHLTGVDLSERQLERARARVPTARFVRADLTSVEFPPASFAAIVAYYVFNHVPRELLGDVLTRSCTWLRENGWLMATFGTTDTEAWTGEWLGAPTFFSSFTTDVNSRLVGDAGLTIVRDDIVTITEPEGPAEFQWILARR
jgi:cyclopropane fatty-acyl-phospholipid synthase-like methyltransferase